eukprot:30025_1
MNETESATSCRVRKQLQQRQQASSATNEPSQKLRCAAMRRARAEKALFPAVRNIARNSQQHHSNSNSNAQPVRDFPKKLESTYSTYASSRVSSRANSTKPAQRRTCPYLEQALPPRASSMLAMRKGMSDVFRDKSEKSEQGGGLIG